MIYINYLHQIIPFLELNYLYFRLIHPVWSFWGHELRGEFVTI